MIGSGRNLLPLTALVLLLLTGCHGSEAPQEAAAIETIRLMPETTEASGTQAPIWEETEVFRWAFKTEADLAQWETRRTGDEASLRSGGFYFRSKSDDPALVRKTSFDAAGVHAIRVAHSGLTSGAGIQIYWTRPGENFGEDRSLATDHPDATGTLTPTFTFDVFRHDLWSGAIDGFRVDPTTMANRRVLITSVSGIGYEISETLLDAAVEKAWRVDFAGDTRYAVLVPPSRPYARELTFPKSSDLRFALGLPPEISSEVRFVVTWSPDGGSEEIVFDETVSPPSDSRESKWLDRRVDMRPYGGRRGRLLFSTESSTGLDLRNGLPSIAGISLEVEATPDPRPNVVLIILDTLRSDGLSCYGNEFDSSPRIDAWARDRGVLFENVVASAPWTLPSHVSIFTGMDPINHSMNVGEPIDESLITLAETLSDQGYATVAFTGGGYLSTDFALMQGFDRVHYFYEPRIHPRETGNDIASGTERSLEWLDDNSNRPFFLLFHSYETHAPYRPREPYLSRFLDIEPGSMKTTLVTTGPVEPKKETGYKLTSRLMQRQSETNPAYEPIDSETQLWVPALYASSVANADAHVGMLLDRLETLGLTDDTIVILTSDHGEALGEGGLGGHATLQECEIMVPLIISAPGFDPHDTRIGEQVQSINITPTILDLLDLEPLGESDGRSLVPFLTGDEPGDMGDAISYAASSNFGLSLRRANRQKYLYNNSIWPETHGDEGLYKLEIGAEPMLETKAAAPQADQIRHDLINDVESRATGLRVRFTNHQPSPMQAILKGWLVNPLRVKSFDIDTETITWFNQRLNFTLDPGESVTFILEGAVTGELQLVSKFDGAGDSAPTRLNRTIDLNRLESSWQAVFRNGSWIEADELTDEPDSTSIRLWMGGLRAAARSASGVNDATREQLRQLGYVVD